MSGVIALRIHGHVDHLHVRGRRSEPTARFRECGERGGANGGTGRISERQQHHFAAVVAHLQRAAVGTLQRKIRRHARRIENAGFQQRRARRWSSCCRLRQCGDQSQHGDRNPAHSGIVAGRALRANCSSTYFSYAMARLMVPACIESCINSSNSERIILRSP